MLPAVFHRQIPVNFLCIRHSCPADQYPPLILCLKSLRRIEVKTHIPLMERLFRALSVFQERVSGLIYVLIFLCFRGKSLWTERQNLPAAQAENIRALPHIAEGFFRNIFLIQTPFSFITGCIEKHAALIASVSPGIPVSSACAKNHKISSVFFPYFRISDVLRHIFRIVFHAQQLYLFRHMLSVFRFCKNLRTDPPCVNIVIISRLFYISGIKKIHSVIFYQS